MLVDLPLLGRLDDYPLGQIDDIVLKPCRDGELVTRLKMAADRRKSLTSPAHGHQGYDPELMEKMNLESLGLLAGGIAHDLNNYLAVILGSIALARAMPPDPEISAGCWTALKRRRSRQGIWAIACLLSPRAARR